jgi:hypothetical protein
MIINSDHPTVDAARVAPRLWIGSQAQPGQALSQGGFTFLVLCAEEWQPPAKAFPGVEVVHAPFDDDYEGIDQEQLDTAVNAVERAVEGHDQGHRVLITCMAGRNRSGLVTAWTLSVLTGIHPDKAAEVVRDKRGLAALTNPSFRSLLRRTMLERESTRPRTNPCELCEARPVTRRYHSDGICWIADCKSCGVPMAVYRQHGVMPPPRHLEHMRELLLMCARPGQAIMLDDRMETIPNHYHVHLRPA